MCIIAAKPAGVAMPDADTIRNMWTANPDGAGLMYLARDRKGKPVVRIEKGFMKLKKLEDRLVALAEKYDLKATPVVMHFRITTHGGTCPELTHPFPVTTSIGQLRCTRCDTTLGVAHNGIITSVKPRKGLSDTAEYIASQLAYLYKAVPDLTRNKDAMQMVSNAIGSKMAFLNTRGKITTVGRFEHADGILYSNDSYLDYDYRWTGWSGHGCYIWNADRPDDTSPITSSLTTRRTLMPLDMVPGSYAITSNGEWRPGEDGDTAINALQELYLYDVYADVWVRDPGGQAFTEQGTPLRIKYDLADMAITCEAKHLNELQKKALMAPEK